MIEKLKMINEGISQRASVPGLVQTINELVEAVNDLEATVYGGDDDCDDLCPDCWAETEPFIAALPDLSIEQLSALQDRVADLIDERLDDDDLIEEMVEDVRDANPQGSSKQPSGETYFVTKDNGLLFDLVKMCITHPELRLWQALQVLSGFRRIWGEKLGATTRITFKDNQTRIDIESDGIEDTFNLTTWGPRRGNK